MKHQREHPPIFMLLESFVGRPEKPAARSEKSGLDENGMSLFDFGTPMGVR